MRADTTPVVHINLENFKKSLKIGDTVPYARKIRSDKKMTEETVKRSAMIPAKIAAKLPYLVKLTYIWKGKQEEDYIPYGELLVNIRTEKSDVELQQEIATKIGTAPLTKEKLFAGMTGKVY